VPSNPHSYTLRSAAIFAADRDAALLPFAPQAAAEIPVSEPIPLRIRVSTLAQVASMTELGLQTVVALIDERTLDHELDRASLRLGETVACRSSSAA